MATLVVGQSGRLVGQDTVGTAAAVSAVPSRGIRFATQQDVSSAREVIGYGVFFGAAAALLVATQPSPIGAANYTAGTHQAAVAGSQPQPQVWGTPPQLMPVVVAADVGRPFVVLQQFYDDVQALVWGPTPTTASAVFTKAVIPYQEPAEPGYGKVWGTAVPSAAAAPQLAKFRFSSQEIVESPPAKVWGTPLSDLWAVFRYFEVEQDSHEQWGGRVWGTAAASVAGTDVVGGVHYTVGTHGDAYESVAAQVWGTPPPSVAPGADTPIGITRVSGQEQIDYGSATFWGKPYPLAQPIFGTRFSAQEQVDYGYGLVWGTERAAVAVVGRTLIAAQEHINSGDAWVWGTDVAAPLGTDAPIGKFSFYFEPWYQPVEYGFKFSINADLIPPAVEPPVVTPELRPAGKKKPKKRYTIVIDGNEFEVDSYEQAVSLLEQAHDAAQPHAEQTARRAEKRIRRKGKNVAITLETPTLSTPDLALQELVATYREKLRRIYEQAAQSSELRELLRRKFAEEDEDDTEVLLLH
jgi:hypothetical protein